MDAPQIAIFSTPLITTWVFDETHRVLFDAGDGVTAMLDSRIHKIRLVAITHTHRDHCAGLLQLLNLRGGAGDLTAVYPEASGAGRALAGFLSAFDSRTTGKVNWLPTGPDSTLPIQPERHFLRTFATDHYPPMNPPRSLSMGFQIVRTVDKVRPEYRGISQSELDALRLAHGKDHITHTVEDVLLSISGDTTPLPPDVYRGTRTLLHECTFLEREEQAAEAIRGHPHTCLEDALDLALAAGVERLGLYHISRRYEDDRIVSEVRERCAERRIPFPVSVALPGRYYDDLFRQCVWQGS
jgi:ribonuclease Z